MWRNICVRCTSVAPSPETPRRESSPTRTSQPGRGRAGRSRVHARGATRVHAHASGRGARRKPFDVRPPRPSADRDRRDALGDEARPYRRARAARRGAATTSSSAIPAGEPGATSRPRAGPHRPHPSRARGRTDAARDRRRAQPSTSPDGARRRTVVAVDRTRGPSPISGLSVIAERR